MTTAAIYARISSDPDDRQAGVDRQVADSEALVAKRKWKLVDTYVDNNISASRYSRKARARYLELIEAVRADKVDRVVFYDVDRLMRQPRDLEDLIDLAEDRGVRIESVVEGEYDLSTAEGRAMARQRIAWAALESDKISRRTKRAKQRAREEGRPGGTASAFGWKDGMTPDPAQAKIVKRLATDFLAGSSLHSIARGLNERNVPQAQNGNGWTPTTVRAVLTSPRNAGFVAHKGEPAGEAKWPAIIDRETFERIRAKFAASARVREPRRTSLLTGLIRCEKCGARMTRDSSAGVPSWRCRNRPGTNACGSTTIVAEPVEELIGESVVQRLEASRFAKATKTKKKAGADPAAELAEIETRLDELAELFGASEITRREWQAAKAKLDARLEATTRAVLSDTGREALGGMIGADARKAWESAPLDRRRAVLRALIDAVIVAPAAKRGRGFDPNRLAIDWTA